MDKLHNPQINMYDVSGIYRVELACLRNATDKGKGDTWYKQGLNVLPEPLIFRF